MQAVFFEENLADSITLCPFEETLSTATHSEGL
jgi:hypothetical protein